MYKKDLLKEYINNSSIRIVNEGLRIRLDRDLASKFDKGIYDSYIQHLKDDYELIKGLNITLPGKAEPIFYLYIVPDNNFGDLLRIPENFRGGKRGGKPVPCYDIDGFNSAYGISQNIAEDYTGEISLASHVNNVHEIAHIFQHQFFSNIAFLGEGFAETVPLYILGLEDHFTEHKELLKNLSEEDIKSAKELIDQERDGTFGKREFIPHKPCSFRESYVSAYLLVRGIIELIEVKDNISKVDAMQTFLEMVKNSNYNHEYLIADIAESIGYPIEDLLYKTDLQRKVINEINDEIVIANKKV